MQNDIEKVLKTIQNMPDESIELIIPQVEAEFKKMVDDQELVNKTKTEFLQDGYTVADIKALKANMNKIADDYFKLVSPTSAKGRYLGSLIGVYTGILDKIMAEGFSRIVNIRVEKISEDAQLPSYAHTSDAGADLFANTNVEVAPNETKIIPTGLKFEIPDGYEVQVRPRSGMSVKTNTKVVFGTVDSDYRGEIGIMLTNYGSEPYKVSKGDKIAQAIIAPVYHGNFLVVDKLGETERGEGGFGSTDNGQEV